ncbi:MAG TPA: hypothetical protein VFW33_20435, partial [Gemmataceae bacterium]|nr:hypothetical protein [Gemmataceae bacterium]
MSDEQRVRAGRPVHSEGSPTMSEQELVRALQELVARYAAPPDPRRVSAAVIARDRWRVGALAAVTAVLWVVGIACVLYMIFWFNRFIIAYGPPPAQRGGDPARDWAAFAVSEEFHA